VDFAVSVAGEPLARLLREFDAAGFTVDPPFLAGFTDELAGMRKVAVACFDSGTVWSVDTSRRRRPSYAPLSIAA